MVVTFPEDSNVVEVFSDEVKLKTSQGTVRTQRAKISTPIGIQDGLISSGAPRLLPAALFEEFKPHNFTQVTHVESGKVFPVEHSGGIPGIAAFASRACPRRRRRVKKPKDDPDVDESEDEAASPLNVVAGDVDAPQDAGSAASDSDGGCIRQLDFSSYVSDAIKYTVSHQACDCLWCRISKAQYPSRIRGKNVWPTEPGAVICADLATDWVASREGETVLLVMRDLATSIIFVKPLKSKIPSGVATALTEFVALLAEIRGGPLSKPFEVHTDLGGEFTAAHLREIVTKLGGYQTFAPKQRHVAAIENTVRQVTQGVRVSILQSGLHASLWPFAVRQWVHNKNLELEIFKDAMIRRGSSAVQESFGALVFAKLKDKEAKGESAGVPCAFLGRDVPTMRRGVHLAYLARPRGRLALTTADGSGLVWAPIVDGVAQMAFTRIWRNLKEFTVRSGPSHLGHPGMTPEQIQKWSDENPVPFRDVIPSSTCAACRGRNRRHTRDGTCRYVGLSDDQIKEYRKQIKFARSEKDRDQILQNIRFGRDSDDVEENSVHRALNSFECAQRIPTSVSSLESRAQRVDFGMPEFCKFIKVANASVAGPLRERGGEPDPEPRCACNACAPAEKVQALGEPEPEPSSIFARKMLRELHAAQLDRDEFWDKLPVPPRAYVTRTMTNSERRSAQGAEALRTEMRKICETYSAIGKPQAQEEVETKEPNATVSSFVLLSFIKNCTKAISEWVYKGRAVVLGNKISSVSNSDTHGSENSSPAWEDMSTKVAALEEGRLVDVWGAINNFTVQCLDVEAAYLQVPWPDSWPRHFLKIPADLWEYLPAGLRPPPKMRNPVFVMLRCIYGHPASGHVFVQHVRNLLEKNGYKQIGKGALWSKGNVLLVTYVDDLKAAGPESELAELWQLIEAEFPMRDAVHTCTEFLGCQQEILKTEDGVTVRYSMKDYCEAIGKKFQELYGHAPRPSKVPISQPLRVTPNKANQEAPSRNTQILVGMLLWLSRTSHPEIAFACSSLGSRIQSWDQQCAVELERLCGFVATHSDWTLDLKFCSADFGKLNIVLYSDADWHSPRSQSGAILGLEGPAGSWMPLLWSSRRQAVVCESAAASETVGAHSALKASWPLVTSLQNLKLFLSSKIPKLRLDNRQILSLIKKGESDKLFFVTKCANLRANALAEACENGVFEPEWASTFLQRADGFTKVLDTFKFLAAAKLIGMNVGENLDMRKNAWRSHNSGPGPG